MGATLVTLAIRRARAKGIGHAATRLLVHMAVTALDKPNARGDDPDLYWAGREDQALALGYSPDFADTPAAHQAVKRAVVELIEKEAIRLESRGVNGRRSLYSLSLLRVEIDGSRTPGVDAHRTDSVRPSSRS